MFGDKALDEDIPKENTISTCSGNNTFTVHGTSGVRIIMKRWRAFALHQKSRETPSGFLSEAFHTMRVLYAKTSVRHFSSTDSISSVRTFNIQNF